MTKTQDLRKIDNELDEATEQFTRLTDHAEIIGRAITDTATPIQTLIKTSQSFFLSGVFVAIGWVTVIPALFLSLWDLATSLFADTTPLHKAFKMFNAIGSFGLNLALIITLFTPPLLIARACLTVVDHIYQVINLVRDWWKKSNEVNTLLEEFKNKLAEQDNEFRDTFRYSSKGRYTSQQYDIIDLDFKIHSKLNEIEKIKAATAEKAHNLLLVMVTLATTILLVTPLAPLAFPIIAGIAAYAVLNLFNLNPLKWAYRAINAIKNAISGDDYKPDYFDEIIASLPLKPSLHPVVTTKKTPDPICAPTCHAETHYCMSDLQKFTALGHPVTKKSTVEKIESDPRLAHLNHC